MKICRISDAFPPPWSGLGPGPWALSRAQAEIGHEVHVITKYRPGCEDLDKSSPFQVHRLRAKSYAFEILAIKTLFSLERKYHFDLIHTHGSSAFLFHLLIGHRFPKPLFMSIHSVRKRQFTVYRRVGLTSNRWQDRFTLLREHIAISAADFFFPVSQGLMQELYEDYDISYNRMAVIGNGADDFLNFYPDPNHLSKIRSELKLGHTPILLFVGALNGRKDIGTFINIISLLKQEKSAPILIVVGSGPKRVTYEELARKRNVAENVRFIENVPPDELAPLYYLADVFVFPSCYEGLPKVLIEAMASGLPVICSRIPGNEELIQNEVNGYLFEKQDHRSLLSQLRRLLNNPTLARKMGQNGRAIASKHYTWQNVAQTCDRYYTKVLTDSKSSGQ